ncbi:MAG: ornithine cyclodeaminase family protein [Deltaproteobacteria bacterium]|nr:ornithine cyclodeaminase family protein [Deltaproteobacteria bacterium]MBW2155235.1 ornithine cyclodeaminase family protein [Deltaproteobacteria bacterium]
MKPNRLLYLSQEDVVSVGLTMTEIIETLEVAFREKGRGNTEMPPKPGIHPGGEDNFIHAMPAYIPALNAAGVKWVSGFPGNQKKGLPYITGLLILNDPETGIPISVMDCVWITAVRTGAATALSARHLARPESSVVGVLGCGVQGRTNLEALNTLFPLKRVMAYDVNTEAVRGYADEIGSRLNLEVIPVGIPREAVTGCDIVVTAGPILKSPHATIQTGWLDEGAFASLVDFDSYWHPDAMQAAAKFCTDDTPQLRQYQQMGYFQNIPEIHADLGELVTGQKPGRETSAERTLTANLGLAIDDMAVAPIIFHKAVEKELGTWLPL